MKEYNHSRIHFMIIIVAIVLSQNLWANGECTLFFNRAQKSNILSFPIKRGGVISDVESPKLKSIPSFRLRKILNNGSESFYFQGSPKVSSNLEFFALEKSSYNEYGALVTKEYRVYSSKDGSLVTQYLMKFGSDKNQMYSHQNSPQLLGVQNNGTLLVHLMHQETSGSVVAIRAGSSQISRSIIKGQYSNAFVSADGRYIILIREVFDLFSFSKRKKLKVLNADTLKVVWQKVIKADEISFSHKESTVVFRNGRDIKFADLETGLIREEDVTDREYIEKRKIRFIETEMLEDNPGYHSHSDNVSLMNDQVFIHIRNQLIMDLVSGVEVARRKVVTEYDGTETHGIMYVGGKMNIRGQYGDLIAYQSADKQNSRTFIARVDEQGNSQIMHEYSSVYVPEISLLGRSKPHLFIDRISDQVFRVWNLRSMKFIDFEVPAHKSLVQSLFISDNFTTAYINQSDTNRPHLDNSTWFKLPQTVVMFLAK